METILELEGVTKGYPGFQLREAEFRLERGFVMGLIGRNGAGKTTTIKLIMNLIRPDAGHIRLFGREIRDDLSEVGDRIGFVYDDPCFYASITVAETEAVIAPFYRRWSRERYRHFVDQFGLNPQAKFGALSHGQRTLLALAVALSHDAELIIMDEPTSGLDPVFRRELIELLYEIIQDEGRSILLSTHITADLERIADYVTLIDGGRILLSEAKDELLERYRVVRGPSDRLSPELRGHCDGIRETAAGFEALCSEPEVVAQSLGGRCVVERASIDDLMVYLVGRYHHVG